MSEKDIICKNCGNKLGEDDIFCRKCGKKVEIEENIENSSICLTEIGRLADESQHYLKYSTISKLSKGELESFTPIFLAEKDIHNSEEILENSQEYPQPELEKCTLEKSLEDNKELTSSVALKKNISKKCAFVLGLVVVGMVCVVGVFLKSNKTDDNYFKKNDEVVVSNTTSEPINTLTSTMEIAGVLKNDGPFEKDDIDIMYMSSSVFGNEEIERGQIRTITFKNTLKNCPTNAWDVSVEQNGKIMAWIVTNEEMYDLYIASDGKIAAPSNSTDLFFAFGACESIDFGECFDTSQVKDMSCMFEGCRKIKKLDLSSFDTSQVINMNYMFYRCGSMIELDVSNFDTSQVVDMSCMFQFCSVTELDVSNFNTSQVTNMGAMFSDCYSIKKLDVSSFDTLQVTNMGGMFWGCDKLQSKPQITLPHGIDAASVFSGTKWEQDYVSVLNNDVIFQNNKYDEYGNKIYQNVFGNSQIKREDIQRITFKNTLEDCPMDAWDASKEKNGRIKAWVEGGNLYIASDGKIYAPSNSEYLFASFACESIDFGDCFDTSQVENMNNMFSYCVNLSEVDVSNFDTSQVTNMNGMFYRCKNILKLDVSHFNTSQVTDMRDMFGDCSSLTELDISNFNTSQVTDMGWIFRGCSSVIELDVSNFDTSQVTDMCCMFDYCSSVEKLDVSNFDTSQVTDMCCMFDYCSSVKKLDVSNFDTSQVTNMGAMFEECNSITELDVSNFDTSQVKNMNSMFAMCSNVTKLDVSNFNTSQVTDMLRMFVGCSNLAELDVSNFDTSQVTDAYVMFSGCSALQSKPQITFPDATGTDGMFDGTRWEYDGELDYNLVYAGILESFKLNYNETEWCWIEYVYYDINKDGYVECIVKDGTSLMSNIYSIFTTDGVNVGLIGVIETWHSSLYECLETNGIYIHNGYLEYEEVRLVSIQNGNQIQNELVYTNDSGEYSNWSNYHNLIQMYKLT